MKISTITVKFFNFRSAFRQFQDYGLDLKVEKCTDAPWIWQKWRVEVPLETR